MVLFQKKNKKSLLVRSGHLANNKVRLDWDSGGAQRKLWAQAKIFDHCVNAWTVRT
jgi:hypothetical protein